jgi:hypothetical protein
MRRVPEIPPAHPRPGRRRFLQVGGLGLAGLGLGDLLRRDAEAAANPAVARAPRARSVIYLFQSGGPAQHETWDLKPDAPTGVRGEFAPIDTVTPGLQICEHLPGLARRSDRFALLRSFSHTSDDHSFGRHMMLTGNDERPAGFDPDRPTTSDLPSMAAPVTYLARDRDPGGEVPPSVVLPHPLMKQKRFAARSVAAGVDDLASRDHAQAPPAPLIDGVLDE